MTKAPFTAGVLASALAAHLGRWPAVRLAVAVSGGADSAALLAAAQTVAAENPSVRLRALHVNHGLHAASAALAATAAATASRLGVACETLTVTVPEHPATGVEAAAREARYTALALSLASGECLLTAHHQEDQAETLLLQLLRGAGVAGAAGMPDVVPLGKGFHLRPLLGVARASLKAYALERGLEFLEDPMNDDRRYDRVYLRQALWPLLVARWPGAAKTLARAAGHFREARALLVERAEEDLAPARHGAGLKIDALRALSPERRANLLRAYLAAQELPPPPAARLTAVLTIPEARPGTRPLVTWPGAEVRRHGGCLYAFAPLPPWSGEAVALDVGVSADLGALGRVVLVPATGEADTPRLAAHCRPLTLKARAGGERLRLNAGAPRRAVKDWLRERGLPPWVRERLPFLWFGTQCAGLLTPAGAWLDVDCRAAPGSAGFRPDWRGFPQALQASQLSGPPESSTLNSP